jgi:hypothetical protein
MSAICNSSPVLSRFMFRHSVPCHRSGAPHFWRPSFVLSLFRLMSLATEFQIRYFFSIPPCNALLTKHNQRKTATVMQYWSSRRRHKAVSLITNLAFAVWKPNGNEVGLKKQKERQETTRKLETLHYMNTGITMETEPRSLLHAGKNSTFMYSTAH